MDRLETFLNSEIVAHLTADERELIGIKGMMVLIIHFTNDTIF